MNQPQTCQNWTEPALMAHTTYDSTKQTANSASEMSARRRRRRFALAENCGASGSAGDDTPVDHAWVYAVVGGSGCCFDSLYGSHFAENPRDYCMASAEFLRQTHQWDE